MSDVFTAERKMGRRTDRPTPEAEDRSHLRDDTSPLASTISSSTDMLSRWHMVYSSVLLAVVSHKCTHLLLILKLTHALLVLATDCGIRVQLFLYLRNLRKPDSVPVNLFESLIISYI